MMRFASALLLLALSSSAEAAHCGHGKVYRVSMRICVSAHSHLAREIRQGAAAGPVEVRSNPPHRAEPGNYYVEILIPVTDTILPFDIPTSVMGRPQGYWGAP